MRQPTAATERPNPISAPVLEPGLLTRIRELNRDYVDVLAREYARPEAAAQLQYFPDRVARALIALSSAARRELAAAPFALYSLSFENERVWRAGWEDDEAGVERRYGQPPPVSLQGPFGETALLQAWHVAACSPLAARLIYGMNEVMAHRIAAAPLWRLKRVMSDHPAVLTPRWPTNPAFWPDLVRFAAARDLRRLHATHLLGSCLMAADLEHTPEHARRNRQPILTSVLHMTARPRAAPASP